MIIKQHLALFEYCHLTEGGLHPGGGGGLISGYIFCFQVDGPITGGGLYPEFCGIIVTFDECYIVDHFVLTTPLFNNKKLL